MQVAVFADLEGSFGIWRMRQCFTGTPEWQYGRECLTADVNSVIDGAFKGGASTVTVKDTHDTGFNCLLPKLDSRASYIGGHFVKPSFFGDLSSYDLILYFAIHAAAGTPNSFFPHTHYGVFSEVLVNGKPACEMDIYGGYLGEFGLPIGFVSGEEIATQQALLNLPWVKHVPVDKRKEVYTEGDTSVNYLTEGRAQLCQEAAQAVADAPHMEPLLFQGDLHFEATFRSLELAHKFNSWHFPQYEKKVEWDSKNMREGFDKLNLLTFFPRKIYPIREPLLFFMRRFNFIKNNYFAPEPKREGAVHEFK
ncbi:M55 family metallopeptidase, partial [candidate division CSSED10-310 bacterium]